MQSTAIVVLPLSCTLAGCNREPQAAAFSDSRNAGAPRDDVTGGHSAGGGVDVSVRYTADHRVVTADGHGPAPDVAEAAEADLVRRLRSGDEEAFAVLVTRHHAAMVRLALTYVRTRPVAQRRQPS